MINFLNAKIQKTELNDFLKIAAITCFISDIANVCYIIYSYLPLSLNRVLLQSTLMNQGIMVSKLGPNELEEFKSLLINTFSGAFFIILIVHLVIYILLLRNNYWAKNYVSGYSLLGGILTIVTIPFMIKDYGHWMWAFIMLLTCIVYFYIYTGLRYFKKQEQ